MRDEDGVTLVGGALGMLRNPFQEQFRARQTPQADPVQLALGALRSTGAQTPPAGLAELLTRIRALPGRDTADVPQAAPDPSTSAPAPSGGVFDVPEPYRAAVAAASQRYGIPESVLASTFWNESRWDPQAVAPGDQRGTVNPDTGKPYDSVGIGQWGEQWARARGFDPRDPMASIEQTAAVMKEYADKYGGNPLMARLAYGWGPGNVDAWIKGGADPERLPDGAKVWLPRTAFGIADDRQARAAFDQIVPLLRTTRRMADGGDVAPATGRQRERFWSPSLEQEFQTFMAFDPAVRQWRNAFHAKYGEPPNTDDGGDFDYRGAYLAGNRPQPVPHDTVPHWDSRGKAADHPTAWMNDFQQRFGVSPTEVDDRSVTPEMQAFMRSVLSPQERSP